MIFNRLHIENFGCFHDFNLDLTGGINHISGSNEFGKTTLLAFIRRLFWGFPDRRRKMNMYPPLNGSGRYGGFIELTLDNGEVRRLERFGEKGELKIIRQDGTVESSNNYLEEFGINENFYRNIYAFTIDELTRKETLDEEDIRQKLYGANLTGENISLLELNNFFKRKSDIFFKQRGSSHQIAEISSEISELNSSLSAARSAYPKYLEAQAQCEKQAENLANLQQRKVKLDEEVNRLQLLLKAQDVESELAEDEKTLASLPALLSEEELKRLRKLDSSIVAYNRAKLELTEIRSLVTEKNRELDRQKAKLLDYLDFDKAANVGSEDYEKIGDLNSAVALANQQALQRKLRFYREIFFSAMGLLLIIWNWFISLIVVALGLIFSFVRFYYPTKSLAHGKAKMIREIIAKSFAFKVTIPDDQLLNVLKMLENGQSLQLQINELQQRQESLKHIVEEFEAEQKALNISASDSIKELIKNCEIRQILVARINSRYSVLEKYFPDFKECRQEIISASMDKFAILKAQIEEISTQISSLKKELDNAKFVARQLLENSDTAIIDTQLAEAQNRLREAVSGYLRWSASRKLLALAITRFEREHQSELLRRSGEYFKSFTLGRYTQIRKPLTSEVLRFTDSVAKIDKDFDTLSRGSREAALLAFRLALIAERETQQEKIPLIMDDISVNFDSKRGEAINSELEEFAQERQIIMFCHN